MEVKVIEYEDEDGLEGYEVFALDDTLHIRVGNSVATMAAPDSDGWTNETVEFAYKIAQALFDRINTELLRKRLLNRE
jgi:hypothetical protein